MNCIMFTSIANIQKHAIRILVKEFDYFLPTHPQDEIESNLLHSTLDSAGAGFYNLLLITLCTCIILHILDLTTASHGGVDCSCVHAPRCCR